MKQLALLLCLAAFGMSAQTTTTQTINSKLKLTNVPAGTANDTLLVRGADKVVKKLPKEDLFATIPTPTLDQVITADNMTDNYVLFTGGALIESPLVLSGPSTMKLSADSGETFKVKNGTNQSIFSARKGSIDLLNNSNYYANINTHGLNTNRNFTLPNLDGTFALSEYTVGDFINDNATTMAPSQNAVYDALALKANVNTTVNLTGNQSINGFKHFIQVANFDTGIRLEDITSGGYGLIENDEDAIRFYASPNSSNGIANEPYIVLAPDYIAIKSTSSGGFAHIYASNISGSYSAAYLINASGLLPVIRSTAPASSTAPGVKGEIYVDANYIYYCYDTNLWRRVAGSTW